ncbi:hypothetical protein SB773_34380, partial [Bacillus sp. SIMBA_074]
REGLAIVLVSSEVEEVVEGSSRVIVLRDGSVETELSGDEVDERTLLAALAGDSAADAEPAIDVETVPPTTNEGAAS